MKAKVYKWTLLCTLLLFCVNVYANDEECSNGIILTHGFDSGAAWSTCAVLDDAHGLELTSLRYRAPGDISRSVIDQIHPAQILMHHHDEVSADAQFGVAIRGDTGLGGLSALPFDQTSCSGQILPIQSAGNILCTTEFDTGVLAKFGGRPAIHGSRWQIEVASRRGTYVWTTSISLHEDGVVTPEISLSGTIGVDTAARATAQTTVPATILSSWRIVFGIDGESADQADEFNFQLREEVGNTRPMQVSALTTEAYRKVDRKAFRGWRVRDESSGRGYYLDPANSGYAYSSRDLNWAQFDVAFTNSDECERHALHNSVVNGSCGSSLDDYVNGETLDGAVTLWHQQSRIWQSRAEDRPAITSITVGFDLLPFDWSSQSPFSLGQQ